jgi:phosphoribosylaminoimidazole-succinocarboxamide synthase
MEAIKETHFNFPGQTGFYRGKVRDVYYFGNLMAMVASDRISAFDVVLPKAIPDKGRVLNQIAAYNLAATKDLVPNWVIDTPDPNVTIGFKCEPLPWRWLFADTSQDMHGANIGQVNGLCVAYLFLRV